MGPLFRSTRRWFASRRSTVTRPTQQKNRSRLWLQSLEGREVPAALVVTDAGDAGANTLRGKIIEAMSNGQDDTITFSGVTSITLTGGEMAIDGEAFNLEIDGGAGVTVNSTKAASATSRIFNVNIAGADPTIAFKNLTLSGGNLNAGGGGAVLVHNDTMVFDNVTFSGNKTTSTGGALATTTSILANVTIKNSNFDSNSAGSTGGAINATSTITLNIESTTFNKNSSSSTGGAIHAASSNSLVNITTSTFTNQSAGSSGGALSSAGSTTTFDIDNSSFTGNRGTAGGAMRFTSGANVIIDDCTISGNTAASSTGGGIYFSTATGHALTLTNSTIANNTSSGSGGGIRMGSSGATITLSDITGNTAGSTGGGIYFSSGSASITSSTIAGNSAGSTGGGINLSSGSLTLDSSTVANNISNSTSGGGGINFSTGFVELRNSTLSSNTAANGSAVGGGVRGTSSGTLNVFNSTVTNNTASGAGGGGFAFTATTATTQPFVTITSSIVAQNHNATHPDLYTAAVTTTLTASVSYSIIGEDTGSVSIPVDPTNNNGTTGSPVNALLAKLANYGGPTQTHALQAGSPALDKGFNFIGASFDQRGTPFNRIIDEPLIGNAVNGADIGAYEGFLQIPTIGSVTANNITTGGGTSYTVDVVYNDATGINTATIDINDISIAGFTPVTVSFNLTPATSVTATYTFTPPGGSFDKTDNGDYTVKINANQVEDGDSNAIAAADIATFFVAIPQTFTVTINTDEDDGDVTPADISLREAIKLANATANALDTIVFDAGLANSTITIQSVLGSLTINDPVVITGLGAASLTVDGTGATNTRGFVVDMTNAGDAVTISGLKIQNFSVTGEGGGIHNVDSALTLTDVWLHANTASTEGGGINLETTGATLVLQNSLLSSNTATNGDGGGINSDVTTTTISIKNSAIRDNFALGTSGDGGGLMISGTSSTVTIEGSTLSGNTAMHTVSTVFGGGAMYFNGTGTLTLINSTVSGNSAVASGGGLHIDDTGTVFLKNSTIANNVSGSNGGGIHLSSGTPTLNLYSSIVASNDSNAVGEDIWGAASSTVNMEASAIGDTVGFPTLNKTGFNLTDVDPLLDPLANNGGFKLPDGTKILTHSLSPSSQAKDQGANSLTLTTDQRGAGFLRQVGAGVDMGSLELVTVIPGAVGDAANIPPANPTHVATVTFTDETGINTAGIANGNLLISGPGFAAPVAPTSHTITFGNNGDQTVTVEYTFSAPGGSWDWWENGTYDIEMQGGQVFDTDGTPHAVPQAVIGNFIVNLSLPATITVDKNADVDDGKYQPGELTLREAISLSNSSPTFETINFAAGLNGQTITLDASLGALNVTDAVTITGPGASNLAVSGGSSTIRLFTFNVPGSNVNSTISGLTLRDGKITGSGGAILLADDGLTLSSVTLTNNSSSSSGGAIQMTGGTLVVNNSTLSDNTSGSTGGAIQTSTSTANITINDSTITGNSAGSSGGGVYLSSATVSVTNSTVSSNTANSTGGGITATTGTINVTGSKIIDNTANGTGGGLRLSSSGKLNVTTSTVSGNTGTTGGGAYTATGSSSITYSTFANNVATSTTGGAGLNLSSGTMVIQNSTISQNTALSTGIGGAIRGSSSGTLTIDNTTITRNSAGGNGGGGLGFSGTSSTTLTNVTVTSSIIAQNFNSNHPDLYTAATTTTLTANVTYSVIGADSGSVSIPFSSTNKTGTLVSPLNAKLDPLANYGGPTQTHQLQPGSPAINRGNNSLGLINDQRGTGFVRVIGVNPDSGSFELPLQKVPVVFGDNPANITTGGAPTVDVVVTFDDDVGVDISTISAADFELRRAFGGAAIPAASIVTSPGSGVAQPVDVTITFNAPGGTWDGADTDRYYLWLIGTVSDAATPTVNNVVSPQKISQFDVTLATKAMSVDITSDVVDGDFSPGNLSLREAVEFSNANAPYADSITFALGINPQTITLNGSQLGLVDPVSVTGPGALLLTVSGGDTSRIFNIDDGVVGAGAFALSGMTLSGGKSAGDGGAINIDDESVTITNMSITGNSANGAGADGGGINVENDGATLTILNSNISDNSAGVSGDADGGGVNLEGATNFSIKGSTVANNVAFDDGGGLLFQKRVASHGVLIEGTTISGNTSKATTGGGGGVNFGGAFSSGLTIQNSTISGNSTSKDGGGIQFYAIVDTVTIRNTTIAYNTAGGASGKGGGINHHTDVTGQFNIESTIISDNVATGTGNDIQSTTGFIDSKYNAIGSYSVTNFTDSGGNLFAQNLLLSPLGGYGGQTQTIRPASSSPVVDKGSNPGALTTDQRGAGFARTIDAPAANATDGTDIGAFEVDPNIPAASVSLSNVNAGGGTTYTFTVTYTDDVAIDVSTLDDNDFTVTGPNAFTTPAKFVGVDFITNGTPRVATYSFTPPGGSWNDIDNGTYTVTLNNGEVTDTAGTPNAVPGGALGNFTVAIPVLTTVTTLVDENDGPTNGTGVSLREAIALSNASPSTLNVINFAPYLFTPAGAQTMTLALGAMSISAGVTITGPGADELVIDADHLSRHFTITDGTAAKINVAISDMHLTKGQTTGTGEANAGGAIWVSNEIVNFSRMEFSNNTSSSYGGAIFTDDGCTITVDSSSLHHNTANGGDSTQGGGAIQHMALSGAAMTLRNSTFTQNQAGFATASSVGGAIIMYSGVPTLVMENCTVVGNTAHQAGGLRLFSAVTGNVQIRSSIITDNTGKTSQPNFQTGSTPISFTQSLIGDTVGLGAGYSPDAYTSANVNYAVQLGTLQKNGGPTSTMELLATNTRGIDEGTNPSSALNDQRGVGFVRTFNDLGVPNDPGSDGTDIGAFERQPAVGAPPTASVKIDSGTGQRSMIQSITVTFSEAVTLGANPFTVSRLNTSAVPAPNGTVTLNVAGSGSTYTITFNDPTFAPAVGSAKSLIDGKYSVTLNAADITSVATGLKLDGGGGGAGGDNMQENFHRLFGDINGDGFTDNIDLVAFRLANGSTGPAPPYDAGFDVNGDNFIDNNDLLAFRDRIGDTP